MKNLVTKKLEVSNYLGSVTMWGIWNKDTEKWVSQKGKRLIYSDRSKAVEVKNRIVEIVKEKQ